MRSGTRNQWSSRSNEVICSDFLAEHTSRVAAFSTNCSRFCKLLEIPAVVVVVDFRYHKGTDQGQQSSRTLRSWCNDEKHSDGISDVGLHGEVSVNVQGGPHLPPHLYSVTSLPSKTHTTANIGLHFWMCNILKFTQNSLVVLIPYLLIYSQQCLVMTLLRHIAFMLMFSVLMVLIKRRSFIILSILNHVKWLKPLNHTTLPINTIWR